MNDHITVGSGPGRVFFPVFSPFFFKPQIHATVAAATVRQHHRRIDLIVGGGSFDATTRQTVLDIRMAGLADAQHGGSSLRNAPERKKHRQELGRHPYPLKSFRPRQVYPDYPICSLRPKQPASAGYSPSQAGESSWHIGHHFKMSSNLRATAPPRSAVNMELR